MGVLVGLGDCPYAFGDNPDRRCAWCGDPLPKGRRRWCSDTHARLWAQNHAWTDARWAALCRDGFSCTRCGRGHIAPVLLRLMLGAGCQEAMQRVEWWVLHEWAWFTVRTRLEVHHKTPIVGRHGVNGCHHHLDGLESLCHECHVLVTRVQRRMGQLG